MKKRYFITYDLNKAGQDYENVIQAIKSASDGAWCTYWKSSYLIRSNYQSAQEVSDKITKYLDSNDSLLVIEVINNTKVGYQRMLGNISTKLFFQVRTTC